MGNKIAGMLTGVYYSLIQKTYRINRIPIHYIFIRVGGVQTI